ncbi:MAG TPA: dihydrofolate reductase family protein [Nocardioides sp.]|nr:dihydrofolate reductase family protein [Nocardioides sp.]
MSALHHLQTASGTVTDGELLSAYPWPEQGVWVRAMMVTTLDGAAAGADGLSGSVSSDADQQVFRTTRRHADAVLVGAQTLRAEEYTPMRAKPEDAEARAATGQLPAPVVVVVSRSLDLPWDLPIWAESTHRPIVLTDPTAPTAARELAEQHADVIELPETSPAGILGALAARGLRRVVCEGGPRLLHELTSAGLVDEVDITIAPLFAGTGRTPATGVLDESVRFELAHVIESEGFLMTRYLRTGR